MYKQELTLQNEAGLHARPASLFVRESAKYKSEILVEKDGKEYKAKSIMSILNMGAFKGDRITVRADGPDEREAVEGLAKLVNGKFGE